MSKKILMLLHENPTEPGGGMGVHVHELALGLAERGWDITVLGCHTDAYGGLFSIGRNDQERCGQENWKHSEGRYRLLLTFNNNEHFVCHGIFHDFANFQNFVLNYGQYLRDDRFDLIHIQDHYLYPVAQFAQVVSNGAPLILTAHLSFFAAHEPMPERYDYRWNVEAEQIAYSGADRIIAVSEAYQKLLDERFLVHGATVIRNGVNVAALDSVKPEGDIHGANGRPVVGFVGRAVPSKGLWNILEAAKRFQDLYFVLFARSVPTLELSNDMVDALLEYEKTHDNLKWHRRLIHGEHWPVAKAAVDVAIMPSLHEPFGIAALEWMTIGKPLIASRVDGMAEFCNDQVAIMIEPTADGLCGGLDRWKSENSLDRIINARKLAEDFDWSHVVRKTEEVYNASL